MRYIYANHQELWSDGRPWAGPSLLGVWLVCDAASCGALGNSRIHPGGIVGVETFLRTSDPSIQNQSGPRYVQRWVSDVTVP